MTSWRTILLDPPWSERGAGKVKRGADRHYPVMGSKDILKTIMGSGVWTPDARCCSVWMWATANYLGEAIKLMDHLGAHYVTNAVWVKSVEVGVLCGECNSFTLARSHPKPVCGECRSPGQLSVQPAAPGLGQRVRMCHEHLLFGRIGKVPVPETKHRLPSVIYAPRGRHSQKPDEAFSLIETHDGEGYRLEMFARAARDGWTAWGNEV